MAGEAQAHRAGDAGERPATYTGDASPSLPFESLPVRINPLVDASVVRCPQCNDVLIERPPDDKWLRYFECLNCLNAFHFVTFGKRVYLERGRTPA